MWSTARASVALPMRRMSSAENSRLAGSDAPGGSVGSMGEFVINRYNTASRHP